MVAKIEELQARADTFIASRHGRGEPPNGEDIKPFPTSLIVPVASFNTTDIPKREAIVKNLLLTQTLSMIYAARGIGKTMLALDLAVNVARGHTKFLEWPVEDGCRVLYVDGEMSASELQERLRKFCGGATPQRLDILSSESFYGAEDASMNLANIVHQERFMLMLDGLKAEGRDPGLIILDNKSALTGGTEENSNSEQENWLLFLRQLRHKSYAVIFVHHAGKSGDQRGASRNEDFLDLVIKLELPKAGDDDTPSSNRGAVFRLTFTKHRGLRPDPAILDLELMEDMDGVFTWAISKPARKSQWLAVAEYIYDHPDITKQSEIAEALKMNAGNLSKVLKYLREDRKLLEAKTLTWTKSGQAYMETVRSARAKNRG
jgi:hypothetical protein